MNGDFRFISMIPYVDKNGVQKYKYNLLNQENDVESYYSDVTFKGDVPKILTPVKCQFTVNRFGQNVSLRLVGIAI